MSNAESGIEKKRFAEEAKKNPAMQEAMDRVDKRFSQVEKSLEEKAERPGWLQTVWDYTKWPLLAGGVIAGGVAAYYGFSWLQDYLKTMFEEYSKKVAGNAAAAREGSQKANFSLGEIFNLDTNTLYQRTGTLLSDGISGVTQYLSSDEFTKGLEAARKAQEQGLPLTAPPGSE